MQHSIEEKQQPGSRQKIELSVRDILKFLPIPTLIITRKALICLSS